MKKLFAVLVITLGLAVTGLSQDHTRQPSIPSPTPVPIVPTGWVNFNSTAGRFTVLMPRIPTDKTQTTPSQHGPYTSHMFVEKGDKSIFLIGWVDYDPSFNFHPGRELDENRDNFLKGLPGTTLVSSKNVTLDGYQALEFTAQSSTTVFRSRVYIVGKRPYQLVTGTPVGVDDSVNVQRFFNSFKVRIN